MHAKSQDKTKTVTTLPPAHPLKGLSTAEFAALGVHQVVFERELNVDELKQLLPMAQIPSEADVFYLIVSADGTPVLVTDNYEAVDDWLDDTNVELVAVH